MTESRVRHLIWAWGILGLPVLLVACAGPARFAQPQDFPLHASDHPFFNLHWRLDREDGVVAAQGLVEAARVDQIAEVTIELRGLDAGGRVVSHALGTSYGGRFLFRGQSWPFSVRLRPTGKEDRFEITVWGFIWNGGRERGGSRR